MKAECPPFMLDHSAQSGNEPFATIGVKFVAGTSSSTTPVKCFEASVMLKRALADGRIVDGDAAPSRLGEDDKVIEVPVQDGRALHFAQMRQFDPQRPRGQVQRVREAHQAPQGCARQRQGKALAHAVQIDIVAVIVRDHGHAGQTAFGRLGGDDDRQLAAPGDIQR